MDKKLTGGLTERAQRALAEADQDEELAFLVRECQAATEADQAATEADEMPATDDGRF